MTTLDSRKGTLLDASRRLFNEAEGLKGRERDLYDIASIFLKKEDAIYVTIDVLQKEITRLRRERDDRYFEAGRLHIQADNLIIKASDMRDEANAL